MEKTHIDINGCVVSRTELESVIDGALAESKDLRHGVMAREISDRLFSFYDDSDEGDEGNGNDA